MRIDALVTGLPTANVQDLTEFTREPDRVLDIMLLFIVTLVLVITILIAVLGIINTLLLSVYERTREIGLLRAVGMGRRQVRGNITLESVIFSLQGTIIGAAIGFVFAWAVVPANGCDTAVTLYAMPVVQLTAMVIAVLVGVIAFDPIPAIIGSRMNVLEAIATD